MFASDECWLFVTGETERRVLTNLLFMPWSTPLFSIARDKTCSVVLIDLQSTFYGDFDHRATVLLSLAQLDMVSPAVDDAFSWHGIGFRNLTWLSGFIAWESFLGLLLLQRRSCAVKKCDFAFVYGTIKFRWFSSPSRHLFAGFSHQPTDIIAASSYE